MNTQLQNAQKELNSNTAGKIDFKGKTYTMVPTRIVAFRRHFPDHTISTEIVTINDSVVLMKAMILDPSCRILSTGFAEEFRQAQGILSSSAVEVAETSAVGRALANFGLIGDGEMVASAEELMSAVEYQNSVAKKGNANTKPSSTNFFQSINAVKTLDDLVKLAVSAKDSKSQKAVYFKAIALKKSGHFDEALIRKLGLQEQFTDRLLAS